MAKYTVKFDETTGEFQLVHDFRRVAITYLNYDDEDCLLVFSEQQFTAIVAAWEKVKATNSMEKVKVEVKP